MEFFRMVDIAVTEKTIQEELTLGKLEEWDHIMGGIRFSMLNCPNALAWTITTGYPPARDKIVLHLTINRGRKQKEIVDEIHLFLEDLYKAWGDNIELI